VLRGVVVAGLGLDRSEKRATPWVSPWWWLASVGPDLRKAVWISPEKVAGRGSLLVVVVERKEKKKKSHAVPIPAGFQVVVESHGQKKFPTPCRPSRWFQVVVERKEKKKKEIPRRRADPMVSGGGYINC
jgi:hypothetical protein